MNLNHECKALLFWLPFVFFFIAVFDLLTHNSNQAHNKPAFLNFPFPEFCIFLYAFKFKFPVHAVQTFNPHLIFCRHWQKY